MKLDQFLINPADIGSYLKHFKDHERDRQKDLTDRRFWDGKKIFITGVSGFVGSHLCEKLLSYSCEVFGFVRRHAVPIYPNLENAQEKITMIEGNLDDFTSVYRTLKSIEPDVIFHLGAQSFIPTSFRTPFETYTSNILGTANILEAVRELKKQPEAIQVAGSSEEYGKVLEDEVPIKETNPLRPMSPYGVAKVSADIMASTYHRIYGLPTTITRGFNHSGPRRGLQFVTSVINRQIARCIRNGEKTVTIGNPNSIRDFTHVHDMIQGYMLAVEKGRPGEPYNLGHGFGIRIGDLVKLAADVAGIEIVTKTDKSRFRAGEVDVLICDYSKARSHMGYRPRIPLTSVMKEGIEYFTKHPELLSIERH